MKNIQRALLEAAVEIEQLVGAGWESRMEDFHRFVGEGAQVSTLASAVTDDLADGLVCLSEGHAFAH